MAHSVIAGMNCALDFCLGGPVCGCSHYGSRQEAERAPTAGGKKQRGHLWQEVRKKQRGHLELQPGLEPPMLTLTTCSH